MASPIGLATCAKPMLSRTDPDGQFAFAAPSPLNEISWGCLEKCLLGCLSCRRPGKWNDPTRPAAPPNPAHCSPPDFALFIRGNSLISLVPIT